MMTKILRWLKSVWIIWMNVVTIFLTYSKKLSNWPLTIPLN